MALKYKLSPISDEVGIVDATQFSTILTIPIFIDDVHCTGEESNLFGCFYTTLHSCNHLQDIAIICHRKLPRTYPVIKNHLYVFLAASECEVDNGGCDHFCTDTIESYFCSCYPGYTLQPDKHTCLGTWASNIGHFRLHVHFP